MDKYMLITYNGKQYKKLIDSNLDESLKNILGDYYNFDSNGFLIVNNNEFVNRNIFNAYVDVIKDYELDENIKSTIISIINKIKLNSTDINLITESIGELAYIYTVVSTKNKKSEKKQNITINNFQISTPKVATDKELSKEVLSADNNAYKNLNLAKQILLEASKKSNFSPYINEQKINNIMSNIVICKDLDDFKEQFKLNDKGNSKFASESEFNMTMERIRGLQNPENGKIILKSDCGIDTIIHEMVHALSIKNQSTGILKIGEELINENENWKNIEKDHIDILNEAMTHYITRELLPELEISSAYNYGADFLKQYKQVTNDYEEENNILEAYFKQNKEALNYIAQDINKSGLLTWHDVLESSLIYQYVNSMILPVKYLKKCCTKETIEKTMNSIANRYKLSLDDDQKLKEFHQLREKYGQEEYERINKIQQIKVNYQNVLIDDDMNFMKK